MSTVPLQPHTNLRERLLDAAEQVVARDGVNSLTLTAVADEAGVSKGGLLYHFPSKSALVVAVVERLATACDAETAKAIDAGGDEPGRFTRAYLTARLAPPDPKDEPIHTALLAAAGTDPQYLDPFRRRHVEWQKRLENDNIDPTIATIVRLAIDGFCFSTMLGMPVPQDPLRKDVIEKLMAMTHPANDPTTKPNK
ncbi:TetR/AcrR family transcriptional regulator [soil metagenome]